MTNQLRMPPESVLEKPIILPRSGLIDLDSYRRVARNQVKYLNSQDHKAVEEYVWGELDEGMTSAFFAQSIDEVRLPVIERIRRGDLSKIGYGVLSLGIWVNESFFDADHKDLIPYSVEHEIIEAWRMTQPGMRLEGAHLAARQHQFNLAALDGKAEKLLEYYSEANPDISAELERAYNIARTYPAEISQPVKVGVAQAFSNP